MSGILSYNCLNVYTVLFVAGSILEYSDQDNILESNPVPHDLTSSSLLPSWIQNDANATLFLSAMTKPCHGKLQLNADNQWIFCPGNSKDLSQGILLHDLSANHQMLLDTGQLFRGHMKFTCIYKTRTQVQLRDSILRHVSAQGLMSLIAPPSHLLIKTSGMMHILKTILPTWEVVTEAQLKSLSKGMKALPSMAIATMKFDAFNCLRRAKYRIIVLNNHDYHT